MIKVAKGNYQTDVLLCMMQGKQTVNMCKEKKASNQKISQETNEKKLGCWKKDCAENGIENQRGTA